MALGVSWRLSCAAWRLLWEEVIDAIATRRDKPGRSAKGGENAVRGPLHFLAAMALFAALDANSKLLAASYPAAQVIFIRFAVLLAALFAARAVFPSLGGRLGTAHPFLQLGRGLAMVGSAFGFFIALREIPLAEGYLVYFTAPFLLLGLSAVLLGERASGAVWGWCGLAFLGVGFALWPGLSGGGPFRAYLWALFGTFCYAAVLIINRRLRHETGAAALILWSSLPGLVLIAPFAATLWVAPDWCDLGLLALNGFFAGAATICLAIAFRYDTAARLAPLEFSCLLFALLLDAVIWGIHPSATTLSGALLVVFALLMSQRAARRAAAAVASAQVAQPRSSGR